jgi:hypothetical protein
VLRAKQVAGVSGQSYLVAAQRKTPDGHCSDSRAFYGLEFTNKKNEVIPSVGDDLI